MSCYRVLCKYLKWYKSTVALLSQEAICLGIEPGQMATDEEHNVNSKLIIFTHSATFIHLFHSSTIWGLKSHSWAGADWAKKGDSVEAWSRFYYKHSHVFCLREEKGGTWATSFINLAAGNIGTRWKGLGHCMVGTGSKFWNMGLRLAASLNVQLGLRTEDCAVGRACSCEQISQSPDFN